LPDRSLMALRAVCARVANLSGAVELHDKLMEDEEGICVLSADGTDADVLTSPLYQRAYPLP
ncbi:hypothetical protein BDV98DRAFT_517759, partial [Pterulicium gracile]